MNNTRALEHSKQLPGTPPPQGRPCYKIRLSAKLVLHLHTFSWKYTQQMLCPLGISDLTEAAEWSVLLQCNYWNAARLLHLPVPTENVPRWWFKWTERGQIYNIFSRYESDPSWRGSQWTQSYRSEKPLVYRQLAVMFSWSGFHMFSKCSESTSNPPSLNISQC